MTATKRVVSFSLVLMMLFACFFGSVISVNAASLSKPNKPSVSTSIQGCNYTRNWFRGYFKYYKKTSVVSWNKVSGADGYEFYYKFNSCNPITKTVQGTSYTLKTETQFYLALSGKIQVKVRAYDIVNGSKVYSSWSPVRNIYI